MYTVIVVQKHRETFFYSLDYLTSWWNVKYLICIFCLYFLKTLPNIAVLLKNLTTVQPLAPVNYFHMFYCKGLRIFLNI